MGTRQLQDAILLQCSTAADLSVDKALSFWSTGHNIDAPAELSSRSQKSWDYPMVQLVHTRLVESLPNATDKARLLVVSQREAVIGSTHFQSLPAVSSWRTRPSAFLLVFG